jgi:pyrimidine deaminase RibD-like protein
MAKLPTADETAREILTIFVEHFKCRPNDVLRINNFLAVWLPRGLATEDFGPGMELAIERGWVELVTQHSFRLTKDGFDAQYPVAVECTDERILARNYMELSIELARKCVSEEGKVSPKVGAVVLDVNGNVSGAYRGEVAGGSHAEYCLLEQKLAEATLAGATLFTTLEPCTSRNHPKIPCAERIVERRIKKVYIGVLDPNPRIRGKGELRLRDAGIEVGRFDSDLMPIIEEMNRNFARQFRES